MTDRRKLKLLVIGFGCYFLLIVWALRYAYKLPYQILGVCAVLNFGILFIFLIGIRKAYARTRRLSIRGGENIGEIRSKSLLYSDRRRLGWLWFGAGFCSLILLNAIRLGFTYEGELPLLAVIIGVGIDASILAACLVSIREIHKRDKREKGKPPQP